MMTNYTNTKEETNNMGSTNQIRLVCSNEMSDGPVAATPLQTRNEQHLSLVRKIDETKQATRDKVGAEIAALQNLQTKMFEKLEVLETLLPSIIDSLAAKHLVISHLAYHKTGQNDKGWEEGDKLNISISAKSVDGKFRFLQFNGYTARGDGRNRERLYAKADKLNSYIKERTGLDQVSVNPMSLETKDVNDTFRTVLITAWIK